MAIMTYPYWDQIQSMLVKGASWSQLPITWQIVKILLAHIVHDELSMEA